MYLKQKSALRFIIGDDSIDLNSFYFSSLFYISVSIYNAYDSECIPSIKSCIWYTNLASGYYTSFKKFQAMFSFTIVSEDAKNARTIFIQYCSSAVSLLLKSTTSRLRSISSATQNDASQFLYIFQISSCYIGNRISLSKVLSNSGSYLSPRGYSSIYELSFYIQSV